MFYLSRFESILDLDLLFLLTHPPVNDQSQTWQLLGGAIFLPLGAQNHPFSTAGCRSARSHPAKLHLRPPVQMYGTFPEGVSFR